MQACLVLLWASTRRAAPALRAKGRLASESCRHQSLNPANGLNRSFRAAGCAKRH
jgi:hypothetical protein